MARATDALPAELDVLSFQPGAASHPYDVAMQGNGIVTFTFANILLPDSNVNETASHGFVGFRVKLNEPVLPGTIISNAADIFFDFNPAVHTNDAVVVTGTSTAIENGSALSNNWIFPNPAHDELMITLDGPATIEVFDLGGRCVLRMKGREPLAYLAASAIAHGQHILRTTGANGSRWARFTKVE